MSKQYKVMFLLAIAFYVVAGLFYVWNGHFDEPSTTGMERVETVFEDPHGYVVKRGYDSKRGQSFYYAIPSTASSGQTQVSSSIAPQPQKP